MATHRFLSRLIWLLIITDCLCFQVYTENPLRGETGEIIHMVKTPNLPRQKHEVNEILMKTEINKLLPSDIIYNLRSRMLSFIVQATRLRLVGVIEGRLRDSDEWQIIQILSLNLSADDATIQRTSLDHKQEQEQIDSHDQPTLQLRVKVCLYKNMNVCTIYINAKVGDYITVTLYELVAIGFSLFIVFLIFSLLLIYNYYKWKKIKKETSNDYNMDLIRLSMESPQQEASPLFNPNIDVENNALENSMDIPFTMDDTTNIVCTIPRVPCAEAHCEPSMSNSDLQTSTHMNGGENKKYPVKAIIHNELSNFRKKTIHKSEFIVEIRIRDEGSVNSQDSPRQMNIAAANSPVEISSNEVTNRQSNGDNPIADGYGTIDDEASYSPLEHGASVPIPYYGIENIPNHLLQEMLGRTHV